jgi:hypothetical protein
MSMQCNYIQTDKISKRKERHTDLVRFNVIRLINEREIGVISVTYDDWYVVIDIYIYIYRERERGEMRVSWEEDRQRDFVNSSPLLYRRDMFAYHSTCFVQISLFLINPRNASSKILLILGLFSLDILFSLYKYFYFNDVQMICFSGNEWLIEVQQKSKELIIHFIDL